jgi:hypothetical protein
LIGGGNGVITVKYIDTIDGIKDLIFEQTYNADIDRTRSSYFYRGMRDASYQLTTSLSRNCKHAYAELEQPLLDNFINYVRIEDPSINESVWKAMVIGQHYGLPTRLLDWTHSTLVALHFANTEDNLDKLSKRDCVVWRIDLRDLNRNLPPKYQDYLERKNTFVFSLDGLAEIAKDIGQYDADMGSDALVCFEPPSVDQRIVNQYSFFSAIPSGITDLEAFLDTHTEHTVKYVIDKRLRWELRDILDQFNINERMIHPGTDGIAKWLARHYYVKSK